MRKEKLGKFNTLGYIVGKRNGEKYEVTYLKSFSKRIEEQIQQKRNSTDEWNKIWDAVKSHDCPYLEEI